MYTQGFISSRNKDTFKYVESPVEHLLILLENSSYLGSLILIN